MTTNQNTRQSFGNSVWDITEAQEAYGFKEFQQVQASITLYANDNYDDYVTWLSNGAYSMVTEVSPFTSSDLTGFQQKVTTYSEESIQYRVKCDAIQSQGMGCGFCMYRNDTINPNTQADDWIAPQYSGIQCTGILAENQTYADSYRTYWFPYEELDTFLPQLEDGTLDLFSSSYDGYEISNNYTGMTKFSIGMSGSSLYQADKFMLNTDNEANYVQNQDIRYYYGDRVYLYQLNRAVDGTNTWLSAPKRTLAGADYLQNCLLGLVLLAIPHLF